MSTSIWRTTSTVPQSLLLPSDQDHGSTFIDPSPRLAGSQAPQQREFELFLSIWGCSSARCQHLALIDHMIARHLEHLRLNKMATSFPHDRDRDRIDNLCDLPGQPCGRSPPFPDIGWTRSSDITAAAPALSATMPAQHSLHPIITPPCMDPKPRLRSPAPNFISAGSKGYDPGAGLLCYALVFLLPCLHMQVLLINMPIKSKSHIQGLQT